MPSELGESSRLGTRPKQRRPGGQGRLAFRETLASPSKTPTKPSKSKVEASSKASRTPQSCSNSCMHATASSRASLKLIDTTLFLTPAHPWARTSNDFTAPVVLIRTAVSRLTERQHSCPHPRSKPSPARAQANTSHPPQRSDSRRDFRDRGRRSTKRGRKGANLRSRLISTSKVTDQKVSSTSPMR